MPPVYVDARPSGLNVPFRPGNALTLELPWPAGHLSGRTFTSTLDGVALTLSVVGDTMTIEVTEAQTAAVTDNATWLLTETTGGATNDVLIGTWIPSTGPGTPTTLTVPIVVDNIQVNVMVSGLGGLPATAEAGIVPFLRGTAADPTDWTRWIFTTDPAAPDSALTMERGQWVSRVIGGSGTQSNRREAWQIPGFPSTPYSRIRSRWASHPPADGTIEHGHMHAMQVGADGKIRAAIVWDFSFGLLLAGVWEANADGSGFVVAQAPTKDQDTVTASSRTSGGVVTLTVATGARDRWSVGDAVTVDLSDNTYDGSFILSAVADTTLTYTQTNGGLDADGGTGTVTLLGKDATDTIVRAWAVTDAVRTNGVVTASGMAAGHPFLKGDRVTVNLTDNTYDGNNFAVSDVNVFTAQISWLQPGVANDASAGSGTVTKASPYWVESRLLPGGVIQARLWPDVGMALNGSTGGPIPGGAPPWESRWSRTWDLNKVTGVTVPSGPGYAALVAAHHSSSSPVRYDSIEAWTVRA